MFNFRTFISFLFIDVYCGLPQPHRIHLIYVACLKLHDAKYALRSEDDGEEADVVDKKGVDNAKEADGCTRVDEEKVHIT